MTARTRSRAGSTVSTASAEWLKLRSVRSTWWFLSGSSLIMLLLAVAETNDGDPMTSQGVGIAMNGIAYFVQFILASMAVVAITSEFATRTIMTTFACTPVRSRVMVAKTAVVGVLVGLSGVLITLLVVVVAAIRFDEADTLSPSLVGNVLAAGGYLTTIAVLSLGVGALVRRTAGGLAIIVTLLMLVPEVLGLLATRFDAAVLDTVADHTPAPAGYRFMAGEADAGITLAAWIAASLALGCWALRSRDA
jgi:ABC-2 type transport system permease protein